MWSKTGLFLLDHELSFLMFKGNYNEFNERASIAPHHMHIKMEMASNGEELLIDAVRSFYNFLMSAGTLVDHYRVAIEAPTITMPFKSAYKDKIQSCFENDLLSITVKKLRNYTAHRSLPAVHLEGDPGAYRLLLDVRDLEQWDNWNVKEKEYLYSMKNKEDILNLIKPYFDKSEALYRWFMLEYAKAVPDDADQLERIYEKWWKPPAAHS